MQWILSERAQSLATTCESSVIEEKNHLKDYFSLNIVCDETLQDYEMNHWETSNPKASNSLSRLS